MIVALATLAAVTSLYWKNHQTIQSSVRLLKRTVTKNFHDPESARFRSVQLQSILTIAERLNSFDTKFLLQHPHPLDGMLFFFIYRPGDFVLCGEVNAKNGYGAYVGYKRFYVGGNKDSTPFIDDIDGDYAKMRCDIRKESVVFSEPDPD